jgi:hypothetical protein
LPAAARPAARRLPPRRAFCNGVGVLETAMAAGGRAAGAKHAKGGSAMSVAKIIEISSESRESFEDAIRQGIQRASKTVKNIRRAWVEDQLVEVDDDKIVAFRVHLKVTFVLD